MFDPVFSVLILVAVGMPVVALLWLFGRRRTARGNAVAAVCIVAPIALFLFYVGPEVLVTNAGMVTVYVLTPPTKATQFTGDLAAIARRHGLTPNLGRSTDDGEHSFYVVEATGHWLRLWATNIPLSGNEDPAICGHHREGYGDPGQYVVTLSRVLPFGTTDAAQALLSSMGRELKAAGYEMRPTPVICSALTKLMPNP